MKTKLSYSDQLKDPRWQKKRLEIMNRDGFKCIMCGDEKTTLNIHHEKYIKGREPWDYEDSCLTTVCSNCHDLINYLHDDNIYYQNALVNKHVSERADSILFQLSWKDTFVISHYSNGEFSGFKIKKDTLISINKFIGD